MEEDSYISIILGRLFLATVGAIIDVKREKITLEVREEKVEFDVFKMAQEFSSMTSYFRMDVVKDCAKDVLPLVFKNPLITRLICDTKEVKATNKVKKRASRKRY